MRSLVGLLVLGMVSALSPAAAQTYPNPRLSGATIDNHAQFTVGGNRVAKPFTGVSSQWPWQLNSDGTWQLRRPDFSDLSGSVSAAQLPLPTASTIGGVLSSSAPSNQFATGINTSGALTFAQPGVANLSGFGANVATALGLAANASGGVALVNGSPTTNNCLKWSSSGIQDAGSACGGAVIGLDVRSIGMTPGGVFDNATKIAALMAANTPTPGSFTGGYPVYFTPNLGQNLTNYYFATPFSVSRGGSINCGNAGGPRYNTTNLVFAAGVHGVINETNITSSDGGVGNADIVGCGIISLGYGTAVFTGGSTSITSIAFSTGGTGMTAPPFAAGDGIMVVPGYAGGTTITGSISGTTLTVTAYSGAKILPGDLLWGGTVSAGTVITADTGGGGGVGTYTVSISQTVASSTFNIQFANTQPVVAPGAFVTAASGNTATLNASFPADTDVIARSGIAAQRFIRLPAARAYTFDSTSGSDTITVTSGPSDTPMMLGDMIWSDAFPFGTIVYGVSGRTYPQTVKFRDASMTTTQNATATKSGGKMWVIPAGINRRGQGRARKNYVYGFGIGVQINCSSGGGYFSGLNCTTNFDQENAYERNFIGRMTSGNNTGASVSIGNEHVANWMDIVENGSVGSAYWGDNSNSAESGQAFYAVRVNCTNPNYSLFSGMYVGWQAAPACIDSSRQLTGPNAYTGNGANVTWDTPNFGPGPIDLGRISGAGVNSPSWILGPGAGNCIKFQPKVGVTQLMQISKDCGTANGIGLGYNATLDRWDWTPSVVGGFNPYLSFATSAYARVLPDGYPTVILARGMLLGSRLTQATAGGEKILDAYSAAQTTNANHKRGDTRLNTTPSAGGYAGWMCTADTCSSVFPFGPIANDTSGTDWTLQTIRSANIVWTNTAPSVSSGFCTGTTISKNNGTAAFEITLGSSGCGATGILTMPAAANGWVCDAVDVTTPDTHVIAQAANDNATTVTLKDYSRTTGAAQNFNASDKIRVKCSGF